MVKLEGSKEARGGGSTPPTYASKGARKKLKRGVGASFNLSSLGE